VRAVPATSRKATTTAAAATTKNKAPATPAAKKQSAAKQSAAKPATGKTAPASKTAPAGKTTTSVKTAVSKTPTAKKQPAKNTAPPKKAAAAQKTSAAQKVPAPNPSTKKASPNKPATKTKTAAGQQVGSGSNSTTTPTTTHVEKKTSVTTTSTTSPGLPNAASLAVRPGEDPWTDDQVAEIRAELEAVIARQIEQIEIVNTELQNLLRDGNDGAGRDPADVGSTNFERDQEMSLAANAREMLDQSLEAVRHIDNGTYGICDHCHEPIGKGRLQAFPRATLCVTCKQREERR